MPKLNSTKGLLYLDLHYHYYYTFSYWFNLGSAKKIKNPNETNPLKYFIITFQFGLFHSTNL